MKATTIITGKQPRIAKRAKAFKESDNMKKSLFIASMLTMTAFLFLETSFVFASEASQSQELEQKCVTTCETGAYGQDTSCKTECYQYGEQEQTITLRDGTVLGVHTPVDAALDTKTMLVVAGLLSSGAIAFVARKKLV